MTKDIEIKRHKGDPTHGNTDYERLKRLTEKEIEDNAKSDDDAPLLSEDELKKFKRVNPKKD
ncbi:MAG: hypothetical protein QM709_03495 [Spongiibacteraceae bacterium]